MDHLKELYHLRWSQETAYRDLKYPLCLKALHSQKYAYIVQEVFARVPHKLLLPLAVTAHVLYRKTVGNYPIFHSGNDAQIHDMLENLYIEYLGHAKYSCTFLNSILGHAAAFSRK